MSTGGSTTADPIGLVLSRLDGVKSAGEGQWIAKCPGHDDGHASLSVKVTQDGTVLLHDHAGCDTQVVLNAAGLEMRDLFVSSNGAFQRKLPPQRIKSVEKRARPPSECPDSAQLGDVVRTFDYLDASGVLLMQICRTDDGGRFVRRPDGNGGWVNNAQGVPRILYGLPDLLKAPRDAFVYDVEGEKDADSVRAAGMVATCNPFGAGAWGKLDDDSALEGRHVVVIGDNDEPGRRHAQDVAGRLHGRAASVRVLDLPGLPEKGDVSDWLANGHDPEDLDRLASAAPEWEPPPLEVAGKLSRVAARRKLTAIFKLGETVVQTGIDLCCELADFYDRGGREALADKDGEPMSLAYISGGLGVSRERVRQYIAAGRTWENLNRVGAASVNNLLTAELAQKGGLCEQLTEAHLRPLSKLAPKEQPTALGKAIQLAREGHELKQAQRKAEGRRATRFRLTAADVSKVVRELLLPTKPKPASVAATTKPDELWKQIAECLDEALALPGVPAEVLTLRGQLHAAFRGWLDDAVTT